MKFVAVLLAGVFALVPLGAGAARTMTIDVKDADITDVIRLLAAEARTNVVPDASLRHDKVTVRLRDVSFEQALAALAHSNDLSVRRDGGVLLIGSAASMNRRFGDGSGPLATRTSVFTLRNARPEELVKPLGDALVAGTVVVADRRSASLIVTGTAATVERARALIGALDVPAGVAAAHPARTIPLQHLRASEALKLLHGFIPDGSAVADDRQNAIVVSGLGESAEAARALIAEVDKPARQVMFEVKVVDVTPVDDASNVGVQLGGVDLGGLPIASAATYSFAGDALRINARLNFLISKGSAKILATPRLVTLNNREASLLIGQTYPIIYYDNTLVEDTPALRGSQAYASSNLRPSLQRRGGEARQQCGRPNQVRRGVLRGARLGGRTDLSRRRTIRHDAQSPPVQGDGPARACRSATV